MFEDMKNDSENAIYELNQMLLKLKQKAEELENGTLTQTEAQLKKEAALTNSRTIRSANRYSTIDELKKESEDPILEKINIIVSGIFKR